MPANTVIITTSLPSFCPLFEWEVEDLPVFGSGGERGGDVANFNDSI
jgi:hypothetical protein